MNSEQKDQPTSESGNSTKPVLPACVTIRGKQVELKKGNEFLDNGACIQLLRSWPASSLIIPKNAWKNLLPFLNEVQQHSWPNCRLYRL